jgi:quinol monooxygenase YgiN
MAPIVFVSRSRVKEGQLEGLRGFLAEGGRALEREKPRTLAFLPYLDEDGATLTIVHVFADAEAMDLHLAGAGERSTAAYEFIETEAIEVYGAPSAGVLDAMRGMTTTGARFVHVPEALEGFLRAAG